MNSPLKRKFIFLLAVAAVLLLPITALAATTFDFSLNTPNTALSPYTGPYANVHIDVTTGDAVFTVTGLTSGNLQYLLGANSAFAANFSAPVTITSISSTGGDGSTALTVNNGFYANNNSLNPLNDPVNTFAADGFGKFNVALDNFDGYNAAVTSLTFTADPTGANFADAALVLVNNDREPIPFFAAGHIFVQDTNNTSGGALVTGYAGNGSQGVVVPVPPTAWLLGSGLLGLLLLGRRRKTR